MDLGTLAQYLRTEVTQKTIVTLDTAILSLQEAQGISQAFLLQAGQFLQIESLSATQIPDPQGTTLTITGGTVSVFGLTSIPVAMLFTQDQGGIEVVLTVNLPTGWSFKDSFFHLDIYPFSKFLMQDSLFIYSSCAASNYAPWNSNPTDTISLSAGLNFSTHVSIASFSNVLQLVGSILGDKTVYTLAGPFDPSASTAYPVSRLSALLSSQTFVLGYSPLSLSLTTPQLVVEITPPVFGLQDVFLSLESTLSLGLEVFIDLSQNGNTLGVRAAPPAGETFSAAKILQLPGMSTFEDYIPQELQQIFAAVNLTQYAMVIQPQSSSVGYLSLSVETSSSWPVLPNVLELDTLTLNIGVLAPGTSAQLIRVSLGAVAHILPKVFAGPFTIEVQIGEATDGTWQVSTVEGSYTQNINLGDMVHGLLGAGINLPSELAAITFSNFRVAINRQDSSYVCSGQVSWNFSLLDTQITSSLAVQINSTASSNEIQVDGIFLVGSENFEVQIRLDSNSTASNVQLTGSWAAQTGDYLQFEDVAETFGFSLPSIPKSIDLALSAASFTYSYGDSTLVFEATSANYGDCVFVAKKGSSGTWMYYFGLAAASEIDLSDLPLIENVLTDDESLAIQQLQVVIASCEISPADASAINALLSSSAPLIPSAGLAPGAALSMTLNIGGDIFPLSIATNSGDVPSSNSSSSVPLRVGQSGESGGASVQQTTSADGTVWFVIQKSFGPVTFERVGLNYKDEVLWALMDASLASTSLTITLLGLAVGSPLTTFSPEFSLDGLGINYQAPGLAIEGAFMKVPPVPPVTLEFSGGVVVKTDEFSINAFGSYSELESQTSLFIFAMVSGSFGGPPYFFVTGFSGGFGYNSQLRLPTQDEIFEFPFVQALSDPSVIGGASATPLQVLQKLSGGDTNPAWITPKIGEVWLAAGIQFTSFKLINTSALLTLQFGKDFVAAITGISKARFPQEGDVTYAYVELQLQAAFSPQAGFLTFTAVLSRNSFVLDPACHLTGGFAMCFWFGDNEHAGDFVLTLGGYSPYFDAPKWYPQEPRLGINWSLDSHVSISGSAYFALTPSALMAGAALSLTFQSGNLKAWFTANADIIIWWNPFRFLADIGISIGASYKIDLLFTSKTVKAELGANLTLWGPPTGGEVTVHWWIISFTIHFGAGQGSQLQPQSWDDFKAVLPEPEHAVTFVPQSGLSVPPPQASSTVAALTTQGSSQWVVRSDSFQVLIDSAIPASELYIGSASQQPWASGQLINVKPMAKTQLASQKRLTLTNQSGTEIDLLDPNCPWIIEQNLRNVPSALWGTGSNTNLTSGDQLINGQLAGYKLSAPLPKLGSSPGIVSLTNSLSYDPLTPSGTVPLQKGQPASGPAPVGGQDTLSLIGQIMGTVKTERDALFQALGNLGLQQGKNESLSALQSGVGVLFVDEPLLVSSSN